MRIAELVRTYKLINDPEAPNWSIKFVGALAGLALVVAGALALAWAAGSGGHADAHNAFAQTAAQERGGDTRTDYVGYLPDGFDPALGHDAARVEAALAEWTRAHPDADVLSTTPVHAGGLLLGYEIAYRET